MREICIVCKAKGQVKPARVYEDFCSDECEDVEYERLAAEQSKVIDPT